MSYGGHRWPGRHGFGGPGSQADRSRSHGFDRSDRQEGDRERDGRGRWGGRDDDRERRAEHPERRRSWDDAPRGEDKDRGGKDDDKQRPAESKEEPGESERKQSAEDDDTAGNSQLNRDIDWLWSLLVERTSG